MPDRADPEVQHGPLRLWHVAMRYRFVILACLAIGVIAASVIGYLLTPIYRAEALVVVEDELPRIVGVQGVLPSEIQQDRHYRTQCTLITSRTVLRMAATRLGLGDKDLPERSDPFEKMGVSVTASQLTNTKLIRIAAEGPDRTTVDDIANAVVDSYHDVSILRRKSSSDFATSWIGEQLPRLRGEVLAAEERLYAFQSEKKVISLDRAHDIVSQRLAQLNQDLTDAEKKRRELEAEIAQIKDVGDNRETITFLPFIGENRTIRELDMQVIALQNQKTDLLRTMKSDHRDVVGLETRIADLEARRRNAVDGIISALKRRLVSAQINERMVKESLAEQQRTALELNEKRVALRVLERDVERAKQLYEPMLDRFGELDLASGLNAVPVQSIEEAEEPDDPVKPRKMLIMSIGALLGLLVGFRLAFLLDHSYSKVRSPKELERTTGLSTVGIVPHMDAKEGRKRALACHYDSKSVAAEAYRSIRTRLLVAAPEEGPLVFLVTGALNDEGKTTTALNIAAAFAQTQKRVLLIDGDLRRSSVHHAFGVDRDTGLSTHLANGTPAAEVVRETEVPSLSIVTAGKSPDNPAELLGSERMRSFLQWARANYDFIIIDSPPIAVVTDASILTPLVDGVLMVVRADSTPQSAVAHSREILGDAKGKFVAAVLNDLPRRGSGYYGYGNGYYGKYGYYHTPYYAYDSKESEDVSPR